MEKKLQETDRQRRKEIVEEGKDINEFFWYQVQYKTEYKTAPNIMRLLPSHWGIK
jgi:hypothetical protein